MKVIVNKKGGIVLPKEVKEQLGIRRGMMLKLEIIDGKIVLTPVRTLADAAGIDEPELGMKLLKTLEEERKKRQNLKINLYKYQKIRI